MTYRTIDVPTPPVLRVIDGQLCVEVTDGTTTLRAGVGDGSWFFGQVVDKLVDPALKARLPRADFVKER